MCKLTSTTTTPTVCTWCQDQQQQQLSALGVISNPSMYHIAFLADLLTTSTGLHLQRYALPPCHVRCSQNKNHLLYQLHKLQELVRDTEAPAKFLAYLESWRFSSAFLSTIDHGAWDKSDRGWTCRVRLTRGPSPFSPCSPPIVSMSSSTSKTRVDSAKVLTRRRFL